MTGVEQIPVGALGTNCYLVWDTDNREAVIIDPGDQPDRILACVREHGLIITAILATHCHFDHIGAVAPILESPEGRDVPFLIHREELSWVEESEQAAARWGFRIRRPRDPDRFMEEGDTIPVGGESLSVLHTPGHSAGGLSLLHRNSGASVPEGTASPAMVFVGDTLFQGSIGRTDFRQGSFEVLERSIREKLYSLPDDTLVYPGHGPRTTIGREKRSNQFVRA